MTIRSALLRARAKTPRQLLRTIASRVWPLSVFAGAFYRSRASISALARTNDALKQQFQAAVPTLDAEQSRCLQGLREHGICTTSIIALLGNRRLLYALQDESDHLLDQPAVRRQIERRRADRGHKWYVVRALGYDTPITLSPALAELFLHPRLLAVVNHYLGQYSRLGAANLWYNLPVTPEEPSIDSERWHRDHEDRRIVKLFCFVDAIDASMGPLRYLRGSHPAGPYANIFPAKPPRGSYPDEQALLAAIPKGAQQTCTGPAGTLVIVDTAGFHQGGRSSTRPRIVLTSSYLSEAGLDQRRIDLAHPMPLETSAKFALRMA